MLPQTGQLFLLLARVRDIKFPFFSESITIVTDFPYFGKSYQSIGIASFQGVCISYIYYKKCRQYGHTRINLKSTNYRLIMLEYLKEEFMFMPLTPSVAELLNVKFLEKSCFSFCEDYLYVYSSEHKVMMMEDHTTGARTVKKISNKNDLVIAVCCSDIV